MFLLTIRKKFIKQLTIVGIVLTALVAIVFHLFIPDRYFLWFPSIPIFFYLIGLFYIGLFSFYYRMGPDKLVICYMICKVVKFVASVLFIAAYGFLVGHEIVVFMLTFVFFFFAFLIFETQFFLRFEAKLKLQKNKKQ